MNDLLTVEDFPIRPKICDGESLEGYCWRIFVENGHPVFSHIRVAIRNMRVSAKARAALAHFLGATQFEEIYARQQASISVFNNNVESIANWLSLARTPRFCLDCLRQYGFHMLYWDFPLMKACTLHGTLLSNRCHSCAQSFSWRKLSFGWICTCGASVRNGAARAAPTVWKTFADLVVSASDTFSSPSIQSATPRQFLGTPTYRISDVYGMLRWALRLRKSLSEMSPFLRGNGGQFSRQGTRAAPGRWEVHQISASPNEIERRLGQSLRQLFRNQDDVLVDFRNNAFLRQFYEELDALSRTPNLFAAALGRTLHSKLSSYSAGIEARNHVCFHPRLSEAKRDHVHHTFIVWWARFTNGVAVLSPQDVLLAGDETNTDSGLTLINAFFSIASWKESSVLLRPLQRRWHLPHELRESSCTVAEIGRYTLLLHEKEQAFVMAFLVVALRMVNEHGDPEQIL